MDKRKGDVPKVKGKYSIAMGFFALIVIGAIVLSSPFARSAGNWGNFYDSLFMACSAVCVTGLSVVDLANEYSFNGLVTMLVLVEIGALGLMTLGTFLLLAIGRRLSLSSEFRLKDAYGAPAVKGLKGLLFSVFISMAGLQGLGVVALYFHGIYLFDAVFYSVMGFCNAGFSIRTGSVSSFQDDPYTIAVLTMLTVLGGIGFLVIYNLLTYRFLRRRSGAKGRISLHSRVVLRFTAYLIGLMFTLFLFCEWNGVLSEFAPLKKLSVAMLQAVTPRTCGFTIVPVEGLKPITRLFYEFMMFIGGAPGSVAGGLKVTTLAVLFYTLIAMCRGETETVIDHRLISTEIVRESIVIGMAMVVLVAVATGTLFVTESARGIAADSLFFEAVSAITTTGLSVGDTTSRLSAGGRIVIMIAMFLGRLGALTVVLMIGDRESKSYVRYPNEEIVVG